MKFCRMCNRQVVPKRKIGVGTLLMVLMTGLMWLIMIPLYPKRCPICNGTKWA